MHAALEIIHVRLFSDACLDPPAARGGARTQARGAPAAPAPDASAPRSIGRGVGDTPDCRPSTAEYCPDRQRRGATCAYRARLTGSGVGSSAPGRDDARRRGAGGRCGCAVSAAGRPGRDSRAIARSPAIAAIAAVALSGCSMSQARGPTPHANVARHLPATASRTPCFAHRCLRLPRSAAGNVGPTKPCAALRPSGSITITSTGERVDDRSVRGTITVERGTCGSKTCASSTPPPATSTRPGGRSRSGRRHRALEGAGRDATDQSVEQAVASDNNNVTAEYDYFANCGECIHDSGWTVNDSYVLANGGPYSELFGLDAARRTRPPLGSVLQRRLRHAPSRHARQLVRHGGHRVLRHRGRGRRSVRQPRHDDRKSADRRRLRAPYACGNSNSPGTSTHGYRAQPLRPLHARTRAPDLWTVAGSAASAAATAGDPALAPTRTGCGRTGAITASMPTRSARRPPGRHGWATCG